jgi:hypothetical protein
VSDISFFHIASVYQTATEKVVQNVRQHHPNNFYFLGVDGTGSFEYLVEPYNVHYRYFTTRVGGPVGEYGYRLNGVLEFLTRFREACLNCNTTHIMMLEDDVYLTKPVTIDRDRPMAGHYISHGNKLHPELIKRISEFTGQDCKSDYYGCGGGSIFCASTFLKNYDKVIEWFKQNFDEVQSVYPTIGYNDCFMVVYYLLCNSGYTVNQRLTDTHNHKPGFDYEGFISNLSPEIEIVNNYKKYYYE